MDVWQLFIRHAHRDLEDRSLDNGLSEKGRAQGQELVRYLDELRPQFQPKKIYCSPKRRCLETAEYVAAWAGLKVEIDLDLDEQRSDEDDRSFLNRIRNWIAKSRRENEICAVSHADVLPIIARTYGSFRGDIEKGDVFWVKNEVAQLINDLRARQKNK